jgi:hypothetical protein
MEFLTLNYDAMIDGIIDDPSIPAEERADLLASIEEDARRQSSRVLAAAWRREDGLRRAADERLMHEADADGRALA